MPREAREQGAKAVRADTGGERDGPGSVPKEREPQVADCDKGTEMDLGL